LNMAYGENSFLVGENGADMQWNPTSNIFSSTGNPLLGGQHVIYVFGNVEGHVPPYDGGEFIHGKLSLETVIGFRDAYRGLSWVVNPLLAEGRELLATDARMRIRINQ